MRLHEYDSAHRNNISKHLRLSSDYERLSDRDFTMICVSTGDEKELIIGHVRDAVDSYCHVAKSGATMVVYSTLPFGSSRKIRQIVEKNGLTLDQDLLYVYMPLMIAQGTTVDDFVNPPFVAFGSYSQTSAESALLFYKEFITSSSLWNKNLPPMFVSSPETAELAKLTANAFRARGFTYVTDIVEGQILAAEKIDDGTAVNLGWDKRYKIRDVVAMILDIAGHKPKVVYDRSKPEGPFSRALDISLAKRLLDWTPRIDLRQGLKLTIDWMRKQNLTSS